MPSAPPNYVHTAERSTSFSDILNTWKPYLNRGVSDFDTRHLITADWVYLLPFGRGKAIARQLPTAFLDAFIGGWQWSGIHRWSSGLPFSVFEPGWTTDWQIESFGVQYRPRQVKAHNTLTQTETRSTLIIPTPSTPASPAADVTAATIRLPYPGEAGQRNDFRGDGYFDVDSGLAKTWKIREYGNLKFAWEVYNVTNAVRFDPAFIGHGLDRRQPRHC